MGSGILDGEGRVAAEVVPFVGKTAIEWRV